MVSDSFSDTYESGYESETGVGAGAGDGVDGGADRSVPEPVVTVAVEVVTNGLSWPTAAVTPTRCFFSTRLRPPRCLGIVVEELGVVLVVGLVVEVVFGEVAEGGVVWVLVLAVALLE